MEPTLPRSSPPDDIVFPSVIPFVLMHVGCLGVIASGITLPALILCGVLYVVRMFLIGAAYHRYFSHRAFATSRLFQFVLAVLAQSTSQKSVLWWAAKHRHHHLHADTHNDVHSPAEHGFLYAHIGWLFTRRHDTADLSRLGDLTKYPELMWLHRHELVPAVVLAVGAYLVAGWPGFFVGFVWSTVLLYHATFCINSLAHTLGTKRYVTGDDSRNNWVLALITFGEGWHNNHHAFQSSARQGFRWWEVDPTYYVLQAFAAVGLIWNLKAPPASVIKNEQRLGTKVIEKVAAQLAATFFAEQIATAQVLKSDAANRLDRIRALLAEYRRGMDILPSMPSWADVRRRAAATYAHTPSLEEIVACCRSAIADAVAIRLEANIASNALHG